MEILRRFKSTRGIGMTEHSRNGVGAETQRRRRAVAQRPHRVVVDPARRVLERDRCPIEGREAVEGPAELTPFSALAEVGPRLVRWDQFSTGNQQRRYEAALGVFLLIEHRHGRGAIRRITLNRPDKLNSFTRAMLSELNDALTDIAAAQAEIQRAQGSLQSAQGGVTFATSTERFATPRYALASDDVDLEFGAQARRRSAGRSRPADRG